MFIPDEVIGRDITTIAVQWKHYTNEKLSNESSVSTAGVMNDLPVCFICSETLVHTVTVF